MRASWSRALRLTLGASIVVVGAGGEAHAASAGDAHAAASGELGSHIQVANCSAELATRLPPIVGLEIDVLLREQGRPGTTPRLIAIRCDDTRAQIAVTMAGANREATIELGGLAVEHRARAVALAAAELVHASLDVPAPEGPPVSSAPPPALAAVAVAPATPGSAPRSAGAPPELLVGGLAQWLGQPAALLLGGRVAFRYPLGRIVVPTISADGALGSVTVPSAEVAVGTLAAALHVYAGTTAGPFRLEAGPGARCGWVHLSGRPTADGALEGHALGAAWGGPEARVRAAYRGRDRRSLIFAIELGAGFVLLPVYGLRDGAARVYAVEGPWMSIGVELGLGL